MAEYFQSAHAASAALFKIWQWSDRFIHADQTAREASVKVEEVTRLLKQIQRTLQQHTPLPDHHPRKKNDNKALQHLREQAQRCHEHIQTGTDDLFGKDAVNLTRKTVKRVQIASKPGRVQKLKDDLSHDLQMLTFYLILLLMQWQETSLARTGSMALQEPMNGYIQQSFLETMRSQELFRIYAEKALEQSASTGDYRTVQDISSGVGERCRKDTSSQPELPDAFPQFNEDAGMAQRVVSDSTHDKYAATVNDNAGPRSAEDQGLAEAQDPLRDDRTSQTQSYPVDVLDDMITRFRSEAAEAHEEEEWPAARIALEGLLNAHWQKAMKTGDAFTEQLILEPMLINVLLQLERWDHALQRIAAIEQQPRAIGKVSCDANAREVLDGAQRDQLKALVLLDRHSKSISYKVRLANDDVKSARLSAHRAYAVHHEEAKQSPDEATLSRYEITVRLLVISLRILDGESRTEADSVLATAESICGHSIELSTGFGGTSEVDNEFEVFEFEGGSQEGDGHEVEARRSRELSGAADTTSRQSRNSEGSLSSRPSNWTSPNLIEAAKKGLVDEISQYLQTHQDVVVDDQDANGWTAMHHAAHLGNAKLVKLLIPHTKADIRANSNGKDTALLIAVKRNQPEVIIALAERSIFTGSRFDRGETVLHKAVNYDATTATEALLSTECGRKLIAIRDMAGLTALHFCCSREKVGQVEKILKYCNEGDIDMREPGENMTALDMALEWSSTDASEIVDMILRKHRRAKHSERSKQALKRHSVNCKYKNRTESETDSISIGSLE